MVSVPYAFYRLEINFPPGVRDENIFLCFLFLQFSVLIKNPTRNSFLLPMLFEYDLSTSPSPSIWYRASVPSWGVKISAELIMEWGPGVDTNNHWVFESSPTTCDTLLMANAASQERKKTENEKTRRLGFQKPNACLRLMRGLIDISDRNLRN